MELSVTEATMGDPKAPIAAFPTDKNTNTPALSELLSSETPDG